MLKTYCDKCHDEIHHDVYRWTTPIWAEIGKDFCRRCNDELVEQFKKWLEKPPKTGVIRVMKNTEPEGKDE